MARTRSRFPVAHRVCGTRGARRAGWWLRCDLQPRDNPSSRPLVHSRRYADRAAHQPVQCWSSPDLVGSVFAGLGGAKAVRI
jgi:hypothetical protein